MRKWPENLDGMLIVVGATALLMRVVCVHWSDLPTGDEINCYIYNAQQFAAHGSLPSLSDHPGVAIVYGSLAFLVSLFVPGTLIGIVAANGVTVAAGVLASVFLYLSLKYLTDRGTAFVVAMLLSVFSGCYAAFRGDLSLYYLFLAALLYALTRVDAKPSWVRASVAGIIAGCFYLCRSDGLYVSVLTFLMAFIVLPRIRRFLPFAVLSFALAVGLFLTVRRGVMGNWGTGTGTRAFDAFYQAEGLHDRKGGSWQDYSERGLRRFGPPAKYGNSVVRLLLANGGAVKDRVRNNLGRVKRDIRGSTGLRSFWVVAILACCFLNRRVLTMTLWVALPCVLTSCIYLAFYFQRPYFVMLSFGLVVGIGAGLASLIRFVMDQTQYARYTPVSLALLGVCLAAVLGYRTAVSFPGASRVTTSTRYWDALVFLKEHGVNRGSTFFAFDHAGSRAMFIYTGGGSAPIMQSDIQGKEAEAIRALLESSGVKYVLAQKEHPELWGLSDHSRIVFANTPDDVRVWAVE